ncbi:hypothetical protein HPP92_028585 [Vanilla planifolia]|uniref:Uncharacterized protein n=1 Tax=Vanilla planifolia TaxID=51239 RepID=A0A835P7J3_VANPL|nr:hypothetical protein HPP92_028585 [Vanilla planifolia]
MSGRRRREPPSIEAEGEGGWMRTVHVALPDCGEYCKEMYSSLSPRIGSHPKDTLFVS